VPVEETREFVVVPVTAVRRASFADQVFVIEPTGEKSPEGFPVLRAHQRFVKLGPTVGNDVIILDGIKNDEQVAASGSFKLREGALVMPAAPAAGTAAAEAPPAPAAEPAAPAPQTSSTGG
jgi:membrane fusion protein (multidrug efflux system)